MSKIKIVGGKPLQGEVKISGSKNACLPIIAASILTDQLVIINNVPVLQDVATMCFLLRSLGAEVKQCDDSIFIDPSNIDSTLASIDIVSKMRASFLVLGPLLARYGKAKVGLPGGCSIGARLINYHLAALAKMGAVVGIEGKYVTAYTAKKLTGCEIFLKTPSVGATENILMAATLAEGRTVVNNAAIEPEIGDLINCLLTMGAKIEICGTRKFIITGVKKLYGCEYRVIPDRIEAATYALAAVITGGTITLNNVNVSHLLGFIDVLKKIGVEIRCLSDNVIMIFSKNNMIKPVNIETDVYPALATDVQSLFMSLLSIADGKSIIKETIFNNRFGHVRELNLMGAKIKTKGNVAYVLGVKKLKGTKVKVTDLRAGAALVLAGLSANGETIIDQAYHIDRGYDNLERKLSLCGANIERIDD
ncbi:MAG: UDP-N-acetylglucosamine 1-carboxyvinyltransferase [Rickettsiaceae bacterium H1]|nr:UDP-N-acetylglucosamine 1-carboxyvinyltransferase [Rickettsiaceae bacterium H1]